MKIMTKKCKYDERNKWLIKYVSRKIFFHKQLPCYSAAENHRARSTVTQGLFLWYTAVKMKTLM